MAPIVKKRMAWFEFGAEYAVMIRTLESFCALLKSAILASFTL
jgi:hypothetical protein